jgi:putative oligomerization/nucleic acid binding protein
VAADSGHREACWADCVCVLALVGTAALRRETATEFPNAQAGDMMATLPARAYQFRQHRQGHRTPSKSETVTVAEQLDRLASLRDRGAITPNEYDTAKNKLLGTTPTGKVS